MSKKNLVIIIILILISLLAGFLIGKISGQKIWQGKLSQAQEKLGQSQKEVDWLKLQLERFYPPLPKEIYSLSGKVTEIGDNFLMTEAQIRVSQFPLPEGKEIEKRNIKVNLTDKTKIFKRERVAPRLTSPAKLSEGTILRFKDIKVGDEIIVTSEENIKGKTEISASQIEIREAPPLIPIP